MKQRNLYRIIIGALMLVSGLISAVFFNRAASFSARFSLWEDVHFSQWGSSGTASTGMVLSQMSDRRKSGLMGSLMHG